jgi:hypothetical protein
VSRSGYTDDDCDGTLYLWRRAVRNAIRGKRGQDFLRELLSVLDTLPEKRLIANSFKEGTGEVCTLGSVGVRRGTDMSAFMDEWGQTDRDAISAAFNIAPSMAAEIMFVNDDDFAYHDETPEKRYARVRAWVVSKLDPVVAAKETSDDY